MAACRGATQSPVAPGQHRGRYSAPEPSSIRNMQTMYRALCALALLAPVALAACGKRVGPASAPDSLRYTVRSVEKSDGECRSTDSTRAPSPCVKVSITWPQLADSTGGPGEAERFVHRLASA